MKKKLETLQVVSKSGSLPREVSDVLQSYLYQIPFRTLLSDKDVLGILNV